MSVLASFAKILTSGQAVDIINKATTIVAAAAKLGKEAKPLLDNIDTTAATQKAREAMDATARAAANAGSKVSSAAGKLGESYEAAVHAMQVSMDARALKKLVHDAKQSVLQSATASMTVQEFIKRQEGSSVFDAFDMPGCFVLVTYAKHSLKRDIADYQGVYVGKALSMGKAIRHAIGRFGNADVYADVKYGQDVRVLIYSCTAEVMDERFDALMTSLEAETSYNAPEEPEA